MGPQEDAVPSVLLLAGPDQQDAVSAALAGSFRITRMASLDEALGALRALNHDCLLVALALPGAATAVAVDALRSAARTTGLVLLVQEATNRPEQLVADYGADDYLLPAELGTRHGPRVLAGAVRRAAAEREHAGLTRRLAAHAVGSTDGLLVVGPDGVLESVSPVAEQFIGAPAAEVQGRDLAEVPWSFLDRSGEVLVVNDCLSLLALGASDIARTGHLGVRTASGRLTRVFLKTSLVRGDDSVVASLRSSGEHLAMQESTSFQKALLAAIGQAVVVTDAHANVVFWNPAAEALYGWTAAEALGRSALQVTPTTDARVQEQNIQRSLREGHVWGGDYTLRRRDGTEFPALVTIAPVFDDRNQVVALIGVSSDLTDRKRAEDSARALSAIVESTADAVFTHDLDGTIQTWNGGAERLFGYPADQVVGQQISLLSLSTPEQAAETRAVLEAGETVLGRETLGQRRDGSTFDVSVTTSPISDEHGTVVAASVIARDISERRQLQALLNHQAMHDALTGLPNRTLLGDRLAQTLANAVRREVPVAVLFLDLDQFKGVNDIHGHLAGDELLVTVAQRLRTATRPADTVARFGGDEFVLVCDDTDVDGALRVAARIEAAFIEPVEVGQHRLQISTSIGIAVTPPLESDPGVLMRSADAALYDAKANGRSRSKVFDSSLARQSTDRLELITELREALDSDALEAHYQPVVELESGRLVGLEALARWRHPTRGWVPPTLFVPLAEQNGLSAALDRWMLRRASLDAARLRSEGVLPLDARVSVNLSANNLLDVGLVELVRHAVEEAGLPFENFELEVTETALLTNATRARNSLTALRELGVSVALDDFGTGYSSLTNLRQLPVTTIKIDRSFIEHLTDEADDFAIVASVLDLGRAVGLRTVAEGVETPEQLDLLHRLGCYAGQGHLWGKALTREALETFSLRIYPAPADPQP